MYGSRRRSTAIAFSRRADAMAPVSARRRITRDLRSVGGCGGGKLGGGRAGARESALLTFLAALRSLRAAARCVMLEGSPVAALRKRDSF